MRYIKSQDIGKASNGQIRTNILQLKSFYNFCVVLDNFIRGMNG